MPVLSKHTIRLSEKFDSNKASPKWIVNGSDATKKDTGDGCIQGQTELTNKGELNSTYYIEFKLGANSKNISRICLGLTRKLDQLTSSCLVRDLSFLFIGTGTFWNQG